MIDTSILHRYRRIGFYLVFILPLLSLFAACGVWSNANRTVPLSNGAFLVQEREQLQESKQRLFDIIFLTPVGQTKALLGWIRENKGAIRIADEKSGIVVARLTGAAALDIEKRNRAVAGVAPASLMRVGQHLSVSFESERLHPVTGLDSNPADVILERRPDNHQLPIAEMGVLDFEAMIEKAYGFRPTGAGTTIAILDTGVDITRTDVFQDRIRVSRDMTSEGRVQLTATTFDAASGTISLASFEKPDEKTPFLVPPEMRATGDSYFAGWLREEPFGASGNLSDFTQDGKTDAELGVLLSRTANGWKVAVDVNGDHSFADEKIIGNFETSRETFAADSRRTGAVRMNVNLPINEYGTMSFSTEHEIEVEFAGFDGGQHGTHVAGIAAGRFDAPFFGGQFRGGAPQAQILGIKVLGKKGGQDADIVTGAVLAAQKGADIINMSLAGLQRPADGLDTLSAALGQIARRRNILFVVAAGNEGPGMNSVGSPGGASRVLTIGAAASGATWRTAFNIASAPDGQFIWAFSSTGPNDRGDVRPALLAPGAAFSSVSLARDINESGFHSGYDVLQGTSMATPAVTGALALLLDAVKTINSRHPSPVLSQDSSDLAWASIEGSTDLNTLNQGNAFTPHYQRFEQGAGLLQLSDAFRALIRRSSLSAAEYEITTESLRDLYEKPATGIYTNVLPPEKMSFKIRRRPAAEFSPDDVNFYREFRLSSDAAWLRPVNASMALSGTNQNEVELKVDRSYLMGLPYGVHEARIEGRSVQTGQLEFVFDVTFVKPREINHTLNRNEILDTNLNLKPGSLRRHFIFVSPERSRLRVVLQVSKFDDAGQLADPRLRLYVTTPNGETKVASEYVSSENPSVEFNAVDPQPGVWEVILFRGISAQGPVRGSLAVTADSLSLSPTEWVDSIRPYQSQIEKMFSLTNYGRTIQPVIETTADRLAVTTKDVKLRAATIQTVTFLAPRQASTLTVRTEHVTKKPQADIDLKLFDSSGKELGSSANKGAEELIRAQVRPGDSLRLEIDSTDLQGAEEGLVDVAWEFQIPEPLHNKIEPALASIGWGRSATFTVQLGLEQVAGDMLRDLYGRYGQVRLLGSTRIFDKETLDPALIERIPLTLWFL